MVYAFYAEPCGGACGGGVSWKSPIVKECAVDVSLGTEEEERGGVVVVDGGGSGGHCGVDEKCKEENGVGGGGGKTVHFWGLSHKEREVGSKEELSFF